jgi:hypothetical protein
VLCIVLGGFVTVLASVHPPGALLMILSGALTYVITDYAVYFDRKTRAVSLAGSVIDDEA